MLHNIVYGILSLVTWSAFFYKAKDLIKDWRNPELRLLSLAIATFATPFVLAAPWLYVRLDALVGYPNLVTLPVYLSVATCLSSFLALLVSWSSAQSKVRLRHRLIVGYAVISVIAMVVLFLMGDVSDAEHPIDFDAYYAHTPYISEFLLVYSLLFAVSMSALMHLCWRYSKAVNKPWLRRGLRVVAVGAVFGLGYAVPKLVSLRWESHLADIVNSYVAPMLASISAGLFAVGFTMPAWGVGLDRARQFKADARAYRTLHPLWSAVAEAFPQIVLIQVPSPRMEHWGARNLYRIFGRLIIEVRDGRFALRRYSDPEVQHTGTDLKFLVSRQVTEIRDGQLLLLPYYQPQVATEARTRAQAAGLDTDDEEAVVEAAQIAAALQARLSGHTPPQTAAETPHDPADGNIEEEQAWLTRVGRAYHSSPIVKNYRSAAKCQATDVVAP
ncbi:MAB_1171c family putative transporter [Streptomyces chrestomyceticus]|uniref:MAB_1171c family putative transporter n=1 Tax=Streptomyces chrestomyceticus TaxID=68185 RepID=UPI0033EEA348